MFFPEKRDVALGKSVTASDVVESSAVTSIKPPNYATMSSVDSWLAIDLGQVENVDRVIIHVAAGKTRYCFNIPMFNERIASYYELHIVLNVQIAASGIHIPILYYITYSLSFVNVKVKHNRGCPYDD